MQSQKLDPTSVYMQKRFAIRSQKDHDKTGSIEIGACQRWLEARALEKRRQRWRRRKTRRKRAERWRGRLRCCRLGLCPKPH